MILFKEINGLSSLIMKFLTNKNIKFPCDWTTQ